MKTDNNSTIDLSKQDETLDNALRKQYKNVGYDETDSTEHCYIVGGKFGANWQKEKDEKVINNLLAALNKLVNVAADTTKDIIAFEGADELDNCIDEAKQLIEQLK